MKKYVFSILLVCLFGVCYVFRYQLYQIYRDIFNPETYEVSLGSVNPYYREQDFQYVKRVTSFTPTKKEDLLSIYYTIINAGKDTFHFYCPKSYESCVQDVIDLANDQVTLSHINNFVHPFNGFKHIETEYDQYGKITLRIDHVYTDSMIEEIVKKKDEIEQEIWNVSMSTQDKIQAAHNYIINHTQYDQDRSDSNIIQYQSDTAYGALLEQKALCGGYTDSMALFLEDLGLKNYKISSENHVWNAVELNHAWYHLDLTWDDPITTDGQDILEYNFFLITTSELKEIEDQEHIFKPEIYQELAG